MESILTYIIQVNLLLVLLYLGYQLLLKNLTFYKLNRWYLLLGAVYAFVYPFLKINSWFANHIELPQGLVLDYLPLMKDQEEIGLSVNDSILILIGLGVAVFFVKLIIQLLSLARIHWFSKPSQWRDYLFRNVVFPITPFSFFNKIYVHKEQHQEVELNDIFKHELVHVRGHHSIDVLVFEIVLLVCWYNPFVWFMRKAVRENLEFLTDQQVLDKGIDRQTYQYSLLHVSKQGATVGISNQFNFKTLKKRIMMMNKKRSSRLELGKYVFLLPVLIFAGITCTVSQAEAKIEHVVVKLQETDLKQQIQQVLIPDVPVDMNEIKKVNFKAEGTTVFEAVNDTVPPKNDDQEKVVKVTIKPVKSERPTLFILDGEEKPADFDVLKLDNETIEHVTVYKRDASAEFGEKGKNGAVVVTTKDYVKGLAAESNSELSGKVVGLSYQESGNKKPNLLTAIAKYDSKDQQRKIKYFIDGKEATKVELANVNPNNIETLFVNQVGDFDTMNLTTKQSGITGTGQIKQVQTIQGKPAKGNAKDILENALVIIDGKSSSKKVLDSLEPNSIATMDNLSPEAAKSLYGKKGEGGAVIITTNNKSK